jgi:hypothetical protein
MKKDKSVYTPPTKPQAERSDDESSNWLDTTGAPWMEVKHEK